MQTIVATIAMERKLKMKIGQTATTVSSNTIKAEQNHAALPEGRGAAAIVRFHEAGNAGNGGDRRNAAPGLDARILRT